MAEADSSGGAGSVPVWDFWVSWELWVSSFREGEVAAELVGD